MRRERRLVGLRAGRIGGAPIALTPGDPSCPPEAARPILDEQRHADLDSVESVRCGMPGKFSGKELSEIVRLTNRRRDAHISLCERGKKQWDAQEPLIMVARGRMRARRWTP